MELKSNLGVNTKAEVVVHHVQRRPFLNNLSIQTNKPYIHKPPQLKPERRFYSLNKRPVYTTTAGRLMLGARSGGELPSVHHDHVRPLIHEISKHWKTMMIAEKYFNFVKLKSEERRI